MKEAGVEDYLVAQVEAIGGLALKGDIKGRRFLDRILILPLGVTVYCEVKRPIGGRFSRHQEETLKRLADMGHKTAQVKTKQEVDRLVCELKKNVVALSASRNASPPVSSGF